jgi:hypothetical protein
MLLRTVLSLVIGLMAAAIPAVASPASPPSDPPMQVQIVRLKGACGTKCPEWIAAQGRLDSAAPQRFKAVLARLDGRQLPVLLDSRGGSVDASLEIGRMIRARKLDVVIGRTVIEPCQPSEAECRTLARQGIRLGAPEIRKALCASACAFLLAGGVNRHVGALAYVGVHEITSVVTEQKVLRQFVVKSGPYGEPEKKVVRERVLASRVIKSPASDKVYAKVSKYLTEMGIAPELLSLARATPRNSLLLLPVASLRATGLATDFQNAEELLFGEQRTRWLPASMPRHEAIGPGAKWIRCASAADPGTCHVLDAAPAT